MAFKIVTAKTSIKENSEETVSKKTSLNNSMDNILVNYGVSFTNEERRTLRYGSNPQKREELKSKIKTCTISEFIYPERYPNNPPLNLTETEKKIQEALRKVYEINGKESPLYKEFPTYRSDTNPLSIDITTVGLVDDCAASYSPLDNIIEFVEIDNPISLVGSIAHELKHAENHTEEIHKLREDLSDNNNYGLHQLRFLDEATAYACGERVAYIAGDLSDDNAYRWWHDTYAKKGWVWNEEEVRNSMIRGNLAWLYDSSYKDKYDSGYPIGENDVGLDHIPEVFHISDEDTIQKLKETPRIARTSQNKLKQFIKNNQHQEAVALIFDILSKSEKIDFDINYLVEHCPTEKVEKISNLLFAPPVKDQKIYFDINYLVEHCPTEKVGRIFDLLFDALSKGKKIEFDMNDLMKHCPTEKVGRIFDLREPDGNPLLDKEELLYRFAKYMNGEPPKEMGKNFQALLNCTDITSKDGHNEDLLRFAGHLALKDANELTSRLPIIVSLKGKDGKPLVSEKQLVENLCDWHCCHAACKSASVAKDLFQCVSDENGNLPVDRKLFDVQNPIDKEQKPGSNLLFDRRFNEYYLHSEEKKKEAFDRVFLYMSLKDKNGNPIISPENIQAIPKENRTLISAIKAYKRQQAKDRLKRFFGFTRTGNSETRKEWKEKVEELKLEKKADKKGRSDTFKKLLKASSREVKKEILRDFHSQQSPAGVKRRTALKFDR
ncbi:MAG: hypothetical protein IKS41_04225 [Alphaproteobacteria bacterium]|nr:hypothetical protein [Alphaproteobacteria bacterium]